MSTEGAKRKVEEENEWKFPLYNEMFSGRRSMQQTTEMYDSCCTKREEHIKILYVL